MEGGKRKNKNVKEEKRKGRSEGSDGWRKLDKPGRQTHHSLCTGSLHPTPAHSQMSCYIAEEEGVKEELELGVNQVQKCIESLHPNTSKRPNV